MQKSRSPSGLATISQMLMLLSMQRGLGRDLHAEVSPISMLFDEVNYYLKAVALDY